MKAELKTIREIVENYFNVDLSKKSRKDRLPDKKKIYSSLSKKYLPVTFCEIAREINADHSTIVVQISKASDLYETDREFRQQYDEIEEMLPDFDFKVEKDIVRLKNRLIVIHREAYLIREELKKRESVKV